MTNIEVVVRCRGRVPREIQSKSPMVVDLPNETYLDTDPFVVVQCPNYLAAGGASVASAGLAVDSKTFRVDRVFGSQADQKLVFDQVVLPLCYDFLSGTNVTVFTYGQTGTGKTYTMVGDDRELDHTLNSDKAKSQQPLIPSTNNNISTGAGIIPRVLQQIFSLLAPMDDYVVKCSFIELYNETPYDLLSDLDANSLRIYDVQGKTTIAGVFEQHLTLAADGLAALARGVARRRTAATKLNDRLSRSHLIFMVELTRKVEGERFVTTKMNLCDLAGSENISRSGATNQRAKEAGTINQSLLALGRVINKLSQGQGARHGSPEPPSTDEVANGLNSGNPLIPASSIAAGGRRSSLMRGGSAPPSRLSNGIAQPRPRRSLSNQSIGSSNQPSNVTHIPYRELNLTRLLQDLLGGSTKTTLIATILPAKINAEETVLTLDYASKAKLIKNTPELGQLEFMLKRVLIKQLLQTILQLLSDLQATRAKNGVYMLEAHYQQQQTDIEHYRTTIKEQEMQIAALNARVSEFDELRRAHDAAVEQFQSESEELRQKQSRTLLELKQQRHNLEQALSSLANKSNELATMKARWEAERSAAAAVTEKHDQLSRQVARHASSMLLLVQEVAKVALSHNSRVGVALAQELSRVQQQYDEAVASNRKLMALAGVEVVHGLERVQGVVQQTERLSLQFCAALVDALSDSNTWEAPAIDEIDVQSIAGVQAAAMGKELHQKLHEAVDSICRSHNAFTATAVANTLEQALGTHHSAWELLAAGAQSKTRLQLGTIASAHEKAVKQATATTSSIANPLKTVIAQMEHKFVAPDVSIDVPASVSVDLGPLEHYIRHEMNVDGKELEQKSTHSSPGPHRITTTSKRPLSRTSSSPIKPASRKTSPLRVSNVNKARPAPGTEKNLPLALQSTPMLSRIPTIQRSYSISESDTARTASSGAPLCKRPRLLSPSKR